MNNFKIALFDLDNTLWNHRKAQDFALGEIGRHYNLPVDDLVNIYRYFNDKAWLLFIQGILTLDDMRFYRFALTFEALGEVAATLDPIKINHHYLNVYGTHPFLCPYAESVVTSLADKFKIGILTNGFKDTQLRKLEHTAFRDYVDFLISPEDTGCLKPDLTFFTRALDSINAQPHEVVYIGDSLEEDIAGGKQAGLTTFWYNPARLLSAPDATHQPDAILTDLRELLDLLL